VTREGNRAAADHEAAAAVTGTPGSAVQVNRDAPSSRRVASALGAGLNTASKPPAPVPHRTKDQLVAEFLTSDSERSIEAASARPKPPHPLTKQTSGRTATGKPFTANEKQLIQSIERETKLRNILSAPSPTSQRNADTVRHSEDSSKGAGAPAVAFGRPQDTGIAKGSPAISRGRVAKVGTGVLQAFGVSPLAVPAASSATSAVAAASPDRRGVPSPRATPAAALLDEDDQPPVDPRVHLSTPTWNNQYHSDSSYPDTSSAGRGEGRRRRKNKPPSGPVLMESEQRQAVTAINATSASSASCVVDVLMLGIDKEAAPTNLILALVWSKADLAALLEPCKAVRDYRNSHEGDRWLVLISDHTATVIALAGNLSAHFQKKFRLVLMFVSISVCVQMY
jgi:hypothetical protein